MKKILVVDDNQQNLYMLQVLLRTNGYEVELASNGAEALEQARKAPPDLIVSDILMPVMDGFALCRAWKADEQLKEIPFIVYTATYTDPRDEELANSLGAERFIIKPALPAEFLALMRETIENQAVRKSVAPQQLLEDVVYYKEYNAALVRKLESKLVQLEEKNRLLELDITKRKEVEAALRASQEHASLLASLLEYSSQPFAQGFPDGKLGIFNTAFLDLVGYTHAELLPLDWARDLTPLEWMEKEQAKLDELHRTGEPVRYEKEYIRKDGSRVPIELLVNIIRDENGQPQYYYAFLTDITERKYAEEEIRKLNAELEERVRRTHRDLRKAQEELIQQERLVTFGRLAGSVAHELRNPLGVITNAVYYLKLIQPDTDAKIKEYLNLIEQETNNAGKIIIDLLEYARIKTADPLLIPVGGLVQNALERYPVPASVITSLKIPDDLPQVYADPSQLEQVFANLVINACQAILEKASRTGVPQGGSLTITARKAGDGVAILFKDNGVGIPAENLKKVFDPLFTTKNKGIGLGLTVSRRLVEANRGRIEVQSKPGKGATFTVHLPTSAEEQ